MRRHSKWWCWRRGSEYSGLHWHAKCLVVFVDQYLNFSSPPALRSPLERSNFSLAVQMWSKMTGTGSALTSSLNIVLKDKHLSSLIQAGSSIVTQIFSTHARTSSTAIFCGLSFISVAPKDLGIFILALVDLQFYRPEFVSTYAGVDTVSFDSRAFIFFCWCNVIILNLKCNHMAMLFEMCSIVTIIISVKRQQQPEELDFKFNAKCPILR